LSPFEFLGIGFIFTLASTLVNNAFWEGVSLDSSFIRYRSSILNVLLTRAWSDFETLTIFSPYTTKLYSWCYARSALIWSLNTIKAWPLSC
jgi:hypothetical protein